jgi:1-deoxy-D-xylulose-5-phosphate reductoisomerase
LSAADEIAVEAFRTGQISFTDIPVVIETVLALHEGLDVTDLGVVLAADVWARSATQQAIRER